MENTKKINPLLWFIRYVRESKEEMRKVTWPSKKDVTKYTGLVVVLALLVALFFGGLDWLLNLGLEALINVTS